MKISTVLHKSIFHNISICHQYLHDFFIFFLLQTFILLQHLTMTYRNYIDKFNSLLTSISVFNQLSLSEKLELAITDIIAYVQIVHKSPKKFVL